MKLIQFQRCENVWVCSFDKLQSFFRPKNNHKSSRCRWIGAFHGIAYEIILAWHFDHCLCVPFTLVSDSMVVVTINDIKQISKRAPSGRDCWYANLFEYISVNEPQRSSFNLVQLNYPNGHIGPRKTHTHIASEREHLMWMDLYSDDLNWKILRLILHGIMTKFHRFIRWRGACCVRRTNVNWSHKFYGHTV